MKLQRLEPADVRKPFDCNNPDLNDFYLEDSRRYAESLYAVTYALVTDTETVAFFSVSNDSIRRKETPKNVFRKIVIYKKRGYESHPAVKIGRFAVSANYQNQGIGKMLMDFIKGFFIDNNKTGCRFILVDAYNEAIGFYQKNGFDFFTSDEEDETRLMYYDLIKFKNAS